MIDFLSDNVNKKVAFHTLGCKVNICETEALMRLFEAKGYEITDFSNEADVYVINTCSVTNIADKKSRQMIHRAKKMNPNALIIATGCYTDGFDESKCEELGCDRIISNADKNVLVEEADAYVEHMGAHTRATIKIEDGCNQFCSYCIIPYKRGRIACRPAEKILAEAKRLAQVGHKEIILTGIHITSYGRDELIKLIGDIAEIEGVKRIRLGSLEPRIIDDEFMSGLKRIEKFCPHFHISLQSGCNKTLAAMNRHYTTDEYRSKVELIRKYFDHPAVTTDVIAGFPGETEEDFEESLAFVDEMKFFEMHIFPYSRREGTGAAKMPNQLTMNEKAARVDRLEEINEKNSSKFREYYIGREIEVLTEEESGEYVTGHTPEYVKIRLNAQDAKTNEIIKIVAKKEHLSV